MSKVLIVDDEPRYRDHLTRALVRDGHDVRTAASGREAISTGSRFRPQVLVADWMLKNRLHGLHVSQALRTVVPELQTILITGFPSSDLRSHAQSLDVHEFIEKPFELAHLRATVREVESADARGEDVAIAVFEVDGDGTITFANQHALELFEQTDAGRDAQDLWQLLDVADFSQITAAAQRWVAVSPRSPKAQQWHLRSRQHQDGQAWLLVVCPDDQRHHRSHPAVRDLLDLEPHALTPWPFEGRAMIVDDDEWVRQTVVSQIEASGGMCHTPGTLEDALRTCERDSEIEVVVVEYDLADGNVKDFVRELRERCPDARIVGTSTSDRSAEFAAADVGKFLLKPWTVRDLINLLLDRIDACVSCGLPLPLRRPQPGEKPVSWECAGCGGRYAAMLDEGFPPDVIGNVRPAVRGEP